MQYIPRRIAPNTITIFSLVQWLIVHFLFMEELYGFVMGSYGHKEHHVPGWKCTMFGLCMLVYMHVDNLDGKQAKRTSNYIIYLDTASPLGMMYDHGVDAVVSFLIGIQFLKLV